MALRGGSFHIILTPSGNADSRFLNGDDGTAGIPLTWEASTNWPTLQGITVNTGFTLDLTTLLDQPGSPDATFSVTPGFALPTGWSISTDDLIQTGGTPGSGSARIRATRLGFTADTHTLLISSIAAPAADTLAPTIPTGLIGTPGVGEITWSWDAACDPHNGTDPGLGVEEYDLDLSGDVTVVATVPGVSLSLSLTNIGSSTPAPAGNQSGASWGPSGGGEGDDVHQRGEHRQQVRRHVPRERGRRFVLLRMPGAAVGQRG
jgi:hypothetical protein